MTNYSFQSKIKSLQKNNYTHGLWSWWKYFFIEEKKNLKEKKKEF